MSLSLPLVFSLWLMAAPPDDPTATLNFLKDLSAIIGPLLGVLGVLGVIYTSKQSRKTGKETVEVSEKDANTRAVAALTEMFTEGLSEVRTELKDTQAKWSTVSAAYKELLNQDRKKEARIAKLENERVTFVDHIMYLETLVPDPPGPPKRPNWEEH